MVSVDYYDRRQTNSDAVMVKTAIKDLQKICNWQLRQGSKQKGGSAKEALNGRLQGDMKT